MDDILVGSPDPEDASLVKTHAHDMKKVFGAFRKYKLTVKGSKVHMFKKMIKFCGHVLFDGKRKFGDKRIQEQTLEHI